MKIIFDNEKQMERFIFTACCPGAMGLEEDDRYCERHNCGACWESAGGVEFEVAGEKKPDVLVEVRNISEEDLDKIAEAVLKRLREPIATEVYFDEARIYG